MIYSDLTVGKMSYCLVDEDAGGPCLIVKKISRQKNFEHFEKIELQMLQSWTYIYEIYIPIENMTRRGSICHVLTSFEIIVNAPMF